MQKSLCDSHLSDSARLVRRGSAARGAGFTIVELIVVIGIITLLIGILLPGLRAVRLAGDRTTESNAARTLMVAYHAYSNANRDRLLTGFSPPGAFEAFDQHDHPISQSQSFGNPNPARTVSRYPWRLAPYFDYDFRGLYTNQLRNKLEEIQSENYGTYLYLSSIYPALGLNSQWLGGDFDASLGNYASTDPTSTASKVFGRFWATTMSEIRTPDRLLVFCSARGREFIDGSPAGPVVEGNFRVRSPRFSNVTNAGAWPDAEEQPYFSGLEPSVYGNVSLRHSGRAVVAFMDGHVDLLNEADLRDMRRWANQADHPDWKLKANVP